MSREDYVIAFAERLQRLKNQPDWDIHITRDFQELKLDYQKAIQFCSSETDRRPFEAGLEQLNSLELTFRSDRSRTWGESFRD